MGRVSNRQILTGGSQIYARKKSRKNQPVEEVTFDREARKEFLTGFHKRKVQRKEKAIERAVEAEKEQKKEEKRLMKQERLRAAQKDLERYEKQIADLVARDNSDYEEEEEEEDETKDSVAKQADGSEEDYSDWEGMENGNGNGKPAIGILKRRAKYEDEDGETTTVTIESMDFNESDGEDKVVHIDKAVDLSRSEKVLKSSLERAEMSAKTVAMMNAKRNKRVQKVNKMRHNRVSKKRR